MMADTFFFIFILIIILVLIILLYFPVLSMSKDFTLSFNPKPTYSVISDEPVIYVNINNERIKTEPVYFIRRSFRFFLYTDYMMCDRKIFSDKNEITWTCALKYATVFKTQEDAIAFLDDMRNNPDKYIIQYKENE